MISHQNFSEMHVAVKCFLLAALYVMPAARCLDVVRINKHMPLPQVREYSSTKGNLHATLALDAVRLIGAGLDVITRCFNGSLPAPTLRVTPGDKLSIKLENKLQGPIGPDGFNVYHHPNTTNVHLHGLHVSPLPPADDVLTTRLAPGSVGQYEYIILGDHSPGTYWFHPHYHGAGVLQTGAGAAGALVVDDPIGFLPEQLENLNEHVIVLQHLSRQKLIAAAQASKDELFKINRWDREDVVLLVNGVVNPVINMKADTWHRLRFIMAGVTQWLIMDFGSCEAVLLAKDGIYINDFPRPIGHATLPPGGRVDLVIRCPLAQSGGHAQHRVVGTHGTPGVGKPSGPWQGSIFTVHVDTPNMPRLAEPMLPWSSTRFSNYLQNTLSESSPQPSCSCPTVMGLPMDQKLWINGHLFEGSAIYMHRSPQGAVVERHLTGTDRHIYHQHTWPFQLGDVPDKDPYFRRGDWHDTYLNVWSPNVTIRFNALDWFGPMVVHCHDLTHADKGMMAIEYIGNTGPNPCECEYASSRDVSSDDVDFASRTLPSEIRWAPLTGLSFAVIVLFVLPLGAWQAVRLRGRRCCARDFHELPDNPRDP